MKKKKVHNNYWLNLIFHFLCTEMCACTGDLNSINFICNEIKKEHTKLQINYYLNLILLPFLCIEMWIYFQFYNTKFRNNKYCFNLIILSSFLVYRVYLRFKCNLLLIFSNRCQEKMYYLVCPLPYIFRSISHKLNVQIFWLYWLLIDNHIGVMISCVHLP